MSYLFFTSYTRSDEDDYLGRFFTDLEDEVRRKAGNRVGPFGFKDTRSIETGQKWEEELSEALCTSKTCLAICSPSFFNSPYCGKEFHVFLMRIAQASKGRAIFPIIWELPRGEFPESVTQFQYIDDDFPDIYKSEGLRYIMKLKRYEDEYHQFLDRLAKKLVVAGESTPLPILKNLPELRHISSAFSTKLDPQEKIRGKGGHTAYFVYISATRDQIKALRESIEAYDEVDGWHWKPFFPPVEDQVGWLAQSVASKLKLRYLEISVTEHLVQRLREIELNREVVVFLADTWTLGMEPFTSCMMQYDEITLANCGVLVPWNDEDPETAKNKEILEDTLHKIFPRKSILNVSAHNWQSIRSPKDFCIHLEKTLSELRSNVLALDRPRRKAQSETLVRQANEQGIFIDTKPNVSGPREETI